jgi:uncharacterized repeat protein (TIGR01451 family)
MISPRKSVVATIFLLLGLVAMAGAYVQPIIVQYRNAAPCGKLAALPRLLHAVGLINALGDCQLAINRNCKNPGAACAFTDPNTGVIMHGICANILPSGCVCTVPPAPDLSITKTHSGAFLQGQTGAQYTITVTNSGNASTSGTVSVSDTLPEGLTATGIAGTNWTCTQPGGPCSRSDNLAHGASYDAITLTVDVSRTAASSVTNSATVSGGSETNAANDTADDPTSIAPFQITSITRIDPDHIMLTGLTAPNDSNTTLEATADLTQQFQFLSTAAPDNAGLFDLTDGDPGTHRFYRLTHP